MQYNVGKLTREMEWVFETAVALEKDIKMRNAILCRGQNIWVVNFDRTIILKYPIKGFFKNDVSFYASDYDSSSFVEEDGTLHFVKYYGEYERKKVSSAMFTLVDIDVDSLWKELSVKKPYDVEFTMTDKMLELFRDDLTHIEVRISEDKKVQFVQRDIFTGNIIYVKKKEKQGLLADPNEKVLKNIEPIALRMQDLAALLYKEGNVKLHLSEKSPGRCYVQAARFEAIVSWCVYDELGTVTYLKEIHTPDTKKGLRLKLREESNINRMKGILSRRQTRSATGLGLKASTPKNMAVFAKKKKGRKGGKK